MKRLISLSVVVLLGFAFVIPMSSSWSAGNLKVTTPNGGQKWKTGKKYAIKWVKGNAGGTVKIQLLKSNKHYKWISKKTKNDGKYTWKIPTTVVTGSAYKVKIVSVKNKKIFDKSNKNFTITKTGGGSNSSITVTTPNGGQKWKTKKIYAIKWSKTNAGSYVKIQLLKSGRHHIWISEKTKNDGKHTWKIPTTLKTSSAYKIKIISTTNDSISDTSDGKFTITNSGYIKISGDSASCELDNYIGFSIAEMNARGYLTNYYSRSVKEVTLEIKLYDSSNRLLLTRYWDESSVLGWRSKSINLFTQRWWNDFSTDICVKAKTYRLKVFRVYFCPC